MGMNLEVIERMKSVGMDGKGLQGKEWEEFRSKEMGKDGIKKEGIEFDQKGWKGKKWK